MQVSVLATKNTYSSPEFIDFCFMFQDILNEELKDMCITQEEVDNLLNGFYKEITKYAN